MRVLFLFIIIGFFVLSCGSPSGDSGSEKKANREITYAKGKAIFDREDCGGCHSESSTIIGPSFRQLASEYEPTQANISHLGHIVIVGVKPNQGIWGSREMTAHPHLSKDEAEEIVKYMLSFRADPEKPFLHNTK